jgi:hypothetical protein
MTTGTQWAVEYPSNSLLTEEQKTQISNSFNNPKLQSCNTRDEVKQAILKITGIPFLQPSYIVKQLSI